MCQVKAISHFTIDALLYYQLSGFTGIGMAEKLALPTLIAICSITYGKSTLNGFAVFSENSISETAIKVDELANSL